ncbi:MAG TPA: low molecular weight protein-tyrosine-phosphatase [Mariprofundaceae bacterium]|nr:low molecular weight protein-tyrosine-phosphatase [Mariprofundaceae bacterium]
MSEPVRVLFVCLGNICRSPLAEIIVRHAARQRQLDGRYHFASAGTGDWHVGKGADPRSAATAEQHGLDLSPHRARQITARGISGWDWFVAMDRENRRNLLAMGVPASRVLLMRQFEAGDITADVPDPYYGGPDGFEQAYAMLSANAEDLLDYLEEVAAS